MMNQILTCIDFQKNTEVLKGSYELRSFDSPPATPVIERAGAFVVVRFWLSLRSWHVSHRIRSVSSEQQTRHTSWSIAGPKRKLWALPQAHTRPEVPFWHLQLSGPSPTTSIWIICRDIQFERNYFTSWRPWPPQQRPSVKILASTLDTAQQQDSSIHGISYAVKFSLRSKCFNTSISVGVVMGSGGYLCMSISIIKLWNLSSYKEITTCKSCSHGDLKYPHINYNATWYLCTWMSTKRRDRIREVVNTIIFCRIHCNLGIL